jgi:glycosyltransferase involved in cell wall biosynthesis
MKPTILLIDVTCPKPYDPQVLADSPLGGTEATVVRVAEALAEFYTVYVAQHNREADSSEFKARYVSLDRCPPHPHAVIILRDTRLLPWVSKTFPKCEKRIIWLHDLANTTLVRDYPLLEGTDVKLIGVSQFHKQQIVDAFLTQVREVRGLTVTSIHNPIADDLLPDTTPVLHRKLVFFSSPHKGLDHTLSMFRHVRRCLPMTTLYVANPGYYVSSMQDTPGVVQLGCLPHKEVIKHVREALAVFHLNAVFPETFGLVHAEALAVGTPVLTARVGANAEILGGDSRFFVDIRSEKAVVERIEKWQQERPTVSLNPKFRLSNIIPQWRKVLDA